MFDLLGLKLWGKYSLQKHWSMNTRLVQVSKEIVNNNNNKAELWLVVMRWCQEPDGLKEAHQPEVQTLLILAPQHVTHPWGQVKAEFGVSNNSRRCAPYSLYCCLNCVCYPKCIMMSWFNRWIRCFCSTEEAWTSPPRAPRLLHPTARSKLCCLCCRVFSSFTLTPSWCLPCSESLSSWSPAATFCLVICSSLTRCSSSSLCSCTCSLWPRLPRWATFAFLSFCLPPWL